MFAVGVALAVAVLLGRLLSNRLGVPDAAVYVLIGAAAGLLPGLGRPELSPELVLLLFLPPLLYYAAFFSDPRETVDHLVPVIGQAFGLVLATAAAAAATLLALFPDVGWAAAIAFGAAIAPPDPVAATTVLQKAGAPSRLVTVLEGEGLVNDGVALSLFAMAVASVGTQQSAGSATVGALVEVGGGIGAGLLVGFAVTWLRGRIRDGPSHVVLSLVTPFIAFVPAYLLHASGVLATVTAAVWQSTRGRGLVAPTARVQTETFWRVLNTLLVALLFVLLGIQVPAMVEVVNDYSVATLALASLALVTVTVLVRMGWALFIQPVLARLPSREEAVVSMPRAERLVLGWCGPRGPVSLAVIMSIPVLTPSGAPFPRRDLLLFLTMVIVLATLVGQVMPLSALLRRLRLSPGERERTEGLRARRATVDAALRELDGMTAEERRDTAGTEAMRQVFELRRDRLRGLLDNESDGRADTEAPEDDQALRLRLLRAERDALHRLYGRGEISGRTNLEISQELDLDETRLRGGH
ncbi:Na+/H+ antiporter [Pseudonocardia acaciae]|uniref:Na+/H+ antiporter n=1 Tax=Pseudonocardia acaciae TaxID=551276 RepID=UPI00068444B8|nr:Na+/H+ antiporter [Pseudonocardia acaciae]